MDYENGRLGQVPSKQESSFVDHDATITQTHAFGHQIDHLSNYELERGLKSRHIQYVKAMEIEATFTNVYRFLALGGAIGTGLFVGSGAILSLVGPAPLFMAYLSMMLVVWIVMNNLAGKI
jgi:amino acid transporter